MGARTELGRAAALFNEAGKSEAERERAHDALNLIKLLVRRSGKVQIDGAPRMKGLTEASDEREPLLFGQGLFEDLVQQLKVVHDPPLSRHDAADGNDRLRATRRVPQRPSC